ncbi:MAG: tetratricopeptide repeat protein [Candidatus Cloacimonetes bacterium]|nr:tetratricopeptide repeat protein [Candidatus Cloacimonadota bacterium]MDD3235756.1 tetratricopeptide repeat protein [Candidatus Cloacimonadota bacterium]
MMNQTELNNLILRANSLMRSNWLHAVHILEQAKEEHPENLRILMNLGDVFLEKRFYEKALSYYQQANAISTDDPQLLYLIGNCYFATGEYRIAITYFNQIDDPPPEVLYNKALGLSFLGSYKESIIVILQILKVLDDNPFIYFLLIEQYLRVQNYDEAYRIINTAEKRFGKHRQLLLLSAVVYSKKGIWLKAFHCFNEYETISPISSPDHLTNFAIAASKIGLTDRAIAIMQRAQVINPYISSVYEELIRLQLQKDDFKEAKASLALAKKYLSRLNPILRLLQERIRNENRDL